MVTLTLILIIAMETCEPSYQVQLSTYNRSSPPNAHEANKGSSIALHMRHDNFPDADFSDIPRKQSGPSVPGHRTEIVACGSRKTFREQDTKSHIHRQP